MGVHCHCPLSLEISYKVGVRCHSYQLKTPWKNGTTHVEFEPVELMAHIPVRHPAGDPRSSKSAILPICHRQTGGVGAAAARPPDPLPRCLCAEREVARSMGSEPLISAEKAVRFTSSSWGRLQNAVRLRRTLLDRPRELLDPPSMSGVVLHLSYPGVA